MKKWLLAFALVFSVSLLAKSSEVLQSMTLEEKVGQLFVIPIAPPRGEDHLTHLKKFLKEYPVGGVIFKQAHPLEQVAFINALQEHSHVPLVTLGDAEWGLGMRMKETLSYPWNLTLGAVQSLQLLREMGRQIGKQCQLVGMHINLAPVADVNTNPRNPIIHRRSFGDDPLRVARQVAAVFQGMQSEDVFACVKHFPGHGDVTIDSHHDLPIIPHSIQRIKDVERLPFWYATLFGVKCVMTGHLLVPAYDNVPATFSKKLIQNVLQKELVFDGLVITDALNMQALSRYHSPGEIALKAFQAGHHLLLYGDHKSEGIDQILNELVPEGYKAILQACLNGEISEEVLNERVQRILRAKEILELDRNRFVPEKDDLMDLLHDSQYQKLTERLYQEAVTLYRDEGLPCRGKKFAYIQVGKNERTDFLHDLKKTFDVTSFQEGQELTLDGFDGVIVALYDEKYPDELKHLDRPIVALFNTPYAIPSCPESGTLVVGYEAETAAELAVSQVLKGKRKAKGRLPVSLP